MPSRNNTFFIAIILAIAFSFYKGTFMQQPIKSPNDTKQYSYLERDNGLRALIISDKTADHAAASLDVHAGSLQDPKERAGLAHFLEHMLFLGTKTYPTAGEYQSFISQHGGSHNAFTAAEHTNYFFQIDASQLEGALDRFSRFFHEPLFTEEYVQREKNAVNSEYQSKIKDDYRRMQYVMKTVINPEHPSSHFSTGNLETLSDNDNSNVRDDLIDFYNRYYSANLMTLTIYGPQDIDTLEQWAQNKFSQISNNNSVIDAYPAKLFLDTPMDITIQPVKDIFNLSFTFELGEALKNYKEKSSQYLGHLLGHEGEGSLLAWLKQKGWAEGLSAGLHNKIANNSTFQINVSLTEDGTQHIDEITEHLFSYIHIIKTEGIQDWVFEELKQLGKLHFTFQEGRRPSQLVQQLSMSMHEYTVEDILQGAYIWSDFNPEKILTLANKLVPENLIRTLTTPKASGNLIEPWFNGPYSKSPIDQEKIDLWKSATTTDKLHIPQPNPFIPTDLSIQTDNQQAIPEKLKKVEKMEAWHMQDVSFKGPQSSIFISFRSNLSKQSPDNQVIIDTWVNLLNDHLNSFSYPASLAGQNYSLYSHMRGIGIRLYGYRDKQDVLLEKILSEIKTYKPTQEQWLQAQQELARAYQNALKQKPYERTMAQLNQSLIQPSFSEAVLLKALKNSSLKSLIELKDSYFNAVDTVILGHGNITKEQLLANSQTIKDVLLTESKATTVNHKALKQIKHGLSQQATPSLHTDSAITLYYQAETKDLKERAALGLLAQIIKAPYYTYMRTERKHGYIVFATPYPILEQGGLGFIVQSPVSATNTLIQESLDFISTYIDTLKAMPEEDFAAHQQGLITNLTKQPLNLQEKTNRLWRDIDRQNDEFNTADKIAEHVSQLTKNDIVAYMQEHIIGDKRKAISIYSNPDQP